MAASGTRVTDRTAHSERRAYERRTGIACGRLIGSRWKWRLEFGGETHTWRDVGGWERGSLSCMAQEPSRAGGLVGSWVGDLISSPWTV